MKIGGLQKFSLIDYPGKISAVIFTLGCNFRCPYCHNPELVIPSKYNLSIDENSVIEFLTKRSRYLSGVVVTGGEPTIQSDIIPFLKKIKSLGYLIKLDTNGNNPNVIKKLIKMGLLNYIAMDIKAPLDKYNIFAGINVSINNIKESISVITDSHVKYEFRTTFIKPKMSSQDIVNIRSMVKDEQKHTVQEFFKNNKILDDSFIEEKIPSQVKSNEILQNV